MCARARARVCVCTKRGAPLQRGGKISLRFGGGQAGRGRSGVWVCGKLIVDTVKNRDVVVETTKSSHLRQRDFVHY